MDTKEEQEQKIREVDIAREEQIKSEAPSAPFLPSLKSELLKIKYHEFLVSATAIRLELAALNEKATTLESGLLGRCERIVTEITKLRIKIVSFIKDNTLTSDDFTSLDYDTKLLDSEVASIVQKIREHLIRSVYASMKSTPIESGNHDITSKHYSRFIPGGLPVSPKY